MQTADQSAGSTRPEPLTAGGAAGGRAAAAGLLGDTASRDYSRKLRLFNDFAAPELRLAVAGLGIMQGMRVLDAGCGTGDVLRWLRDAVGPGGMAVGIDLSAAHAQAARAAASPGAAVLQADLLRACLAPATLDLIWSVNTINHFHDPAAGLAALAALLLPGGRIALGQSALLPEMYFAWDSRLERLSHEAVRRYYQARYGIDERDLRSTRNILGWMQRAGMRNIVVRTLVMERVHPLRNADEAYLLEAIFRGTFGERLRPYLPVEEFEALSMLCDPLHPAFALNRADFHFLQTFTLVVGECPSKPRTARGINAKAIATSASGQNRGYRQK
ncbi:MAG TPA: class I SAM-dependent methyltransferase [Steroidobacteraceae bacterium]|nr:class I SAM-dependent methyltransferase [Steroidobacteraceae bacterium]